MTHKIGQLIDPILVSHGIDDNKKEAVYEALIHLTKVFIATFLGGGTAYYYVDAEYCKHILILLLVDIEVNTAEENGGKVYYSRCRPFHGGKVETMKTMQVGIQKVLGTDYLQRKKDKFNRFVVEGKQRCQKAKDAANKEGNNRPGGPQGR